jgi:hypothetical protein
MPLHVTMDVPVRRAIIQAAVEGLVAMNRQLIALHRPPRLYSSGVVYRREPPGRERWQNVAQTYQLGEGDCEDLAAIRTAELQEDGEDARVEVVKTGPRRYHVRVRRSDGAVEDPSRICLALERRRKRTARRRA